VDRGTARTPFRRVGPGGRSPDGCADARSHLVGRGAPSSIRPGPRPPSPASRLGPQLSTTALLRPQPGGRGFRRGRPGATVGAWRDEPKAPRGGRRRARGGRRSRSVGCSGWCSGWCSRRCARVRPQPRGPGPPARRRRTEAPHTAPPSRAAPSRASPRRAPPRGAAPPTPGRCGRSRRSRWRSGNRRTASVRVTVAWIWPRRRAPPCSPPRRAPSCSPERWRAVAWCRSSTRTGCGPPTNRWPRASRRGRRSRREPCWARSSPATGRVGWPACTGACVASEAATSTRSCCSCRGTSACCRCPIRSQQECSASRARSRATSRPCSWLTRDSVTPSILPISPRVWSSR
jgi:hypothetical protein